MQQKFLKIIWGLYYAFVFLFLLAGSYSYLDPDLGWHLRVGQEILENREVPHIEHYIFSLEGSRWVDHEWLSNAGVYWIYANLGYAALNLFFVLIILVFLVILNIFIKKHFIRHNLSAGQAAFFIMLFEIIGLAASRPHFGVRIQEITVLNLLILIIIIHYYDKICKLKRAQAWLLSLLIPLFYLWASLHGGFLIGFFVMGLWVVFKFFELVLDRVESNKLLKQYKFNFKNILLNKQFKKIILFGAFAFFSLAATFFTPYGFEIYSFLGDYSNTFYLTHIAEWTPFYFWPILYWQFLYEGLFAAGVILVFWNKLKQRKKGEKEEKFESGGWYLFLSSVFFFLALKSRRHFPLFFVVSLPLMVEFFSYLFYLPSKKIKAKNKISRFIINFGIAKIYLVITFLALSASYAAEINWSNAPFSHFEKEYPGGAAEFIKDNPKYLGKRTFSLYGWGGYLVWTLRENQLFLDGRLPQVPFGGHTMLEEYSEFFHEGQARRKLREHDIELVILNIKEAEIKLSWFEKYFLGFNEEGSKDKNYLKAYLDNSKDWEAVYSDEISRIYFKL